MIAHSEPTIPMPIREIDAAQWRVTDTSRMDLLMALIHGSCLAAVVPMTLAIVEHDPMASAGHFDGDLLRGLMEVNGHFWTRHPRLYDRYRAAVRQGASIRRGLPVESSMEFWSVWDGLYTTRIGNDE